jgi:hypothetical protein
VRCGIEAAADRLLEARCDQRREAGIVRLANIVTIEAVELGKVEAGWGTADRIDVEPCDRLLGRNDLVVAVTPA